MISWSEWIYFQFLIFFRMHFIPESKEVELFYFPWVFVKVFITRDDILMTDWHLLSRPFLLSYWLFFLPFSCTKYHKLVWYICRKINFVRMQHYSFAIFPFDYSPLRLRLKAESILVSFPLDFVSLLDIPCKRRFKS